MITERILKKYRKEALGTKESLKGYDSHAEFTINRRKMSDQILQLTQELLDIYLIQKK
jgi:hypothetical protein